MCVCSKTTMKQNAALFFLNPDEMRWGFVTWGLWCIWAAISMFVWPAVRLGCRHLLTTASDSGISTAYKQHYRGMLCKKKKSIFPLFCLTGQLRERDGDTKRRHGGERQDTLIWRGVVLTSLWEALFSLPWKDSMWLILQAVASPCSLTPLSLISRQLKVHMLFPEMLTKLKDAQHQGRWCQLLSFSRSNNNI